MKKRKSSGDKEPADTMSSPPSDPFTRVRLNVGGQMFETSLATLRRIPNTMIDRMFSDEWRTSRNWDPNSESYFIDANPVYFSVLLDCMREGLLPATSPCPEKISDEQWYKMVDFYQLPMRDDPRAALDVDISRLLHTNRLHICRTTIAEAFAKHIHHQITKGAMIGWTTRKFKVIDECKVVGLIKLYEKYGFSGETVDEIGMRTWLLTVSQQAIATAHLELVVAALKRLHGYCTVKPYHETPKGRPITSLHLVINYPAPQDVQIELTTPMPCPTYPDVDRDSDALITGMPIVVKERK